MTEKQKALISLKKAKSLTAKIVDMVENDQYCIDIMQQNLAVIGLLRSAHQKLMENHLNHCFSQAIHTQDENKKDEMIQEILNVSKMVNK